MKRSANLIASCTLVFACGAAAPALALEVVDNPSVPAHIAQGAAHAASRPGSPASLRLRMPDLLPLTNPVLLPQAQSSALPEPEVFAMMLLGLVLIGWRASRDSTDTFE